MAEFHYQPTSSDRGDGNLGSINKDQPPQVRPMNAMKPIDGQSLLNAKAPGKMNENRFTSLKPSRNDK